jgi:RNA polymerase sigma factor (sigma-70 family)
VQLVARTDSAAAQTATTQQFDGFDAFFIRSYRNVCKTVMIAGATPDEAEDAASTAFLYMLQRLQAGRPVSGFPLRYARTAAVNAFIKEKTRGSSRVAQRLIARQPASLHEEDAKLSILEGQEWVAGVLGQLTPAQREVMERIARGLTYEEIAEDLGKSKDVVRRRLCDARARLIQILNPDGSAVGQLQPATAERPPREESS